MEYLSKGIKHIKKRTLGNRIMVEVKPIIRQQKLSAWKRRIGRRSEFIKQVYPDVRMVLYADCILSQAIFVDNFEWQEIKFITHFLKTSDCFIDIGSNFGLYALIAAKKVGRKGRVFAFEPASKTFARLERNIRLNHVKNILPSRVALSSSPGMLPMSISQDGHDAWNSLTMPARGEHYLSEMVQTITLDDFVKEKGLMEGIKMIKIDVEGWEKEVVRGGLATLSAEWAPVLQVEFSEPALIAAGTSSSDLISFLENLGYKMYRYLGKTERLLAFEHKGEPLDRNLYAIKDLEMVRRVLSE